MPAYYNSSSVAKLKSHAVSTRPGVTLLYANIIFYSYGLNRNTLLWQNIQIHRDFKCNYYEKGIQVSRSQMVDGSTKHEDVMERWVKSSYFSFFILWYSWTR